MAYGGEYTLEELVERDGAISRRLLAVAPQQGREIEKDYRDHFTLSSTYPAGHGFQIVADLPIKINAKLPFTRFRVLLRDSARIAHIGLDKIVTAEPGQYDDILPGGNELNEPCAPHSYISIVFDGVPTTPVEVFLYAGEPARRQ